MIEPPSFLKQFLQEGQDLLSSGLLGEIQFSGSTYQVQFFDSNKQDNWAFLHLDDQGELQDSFCSCDESEGFNHCKHIAAAWLRIFNGTAEPLHKRFEPSLWNRLAQQHVDRIGDNASMLKKVAEGHYVRETMSGKRLFSVKGVTKAAIENLTEILEHRQAATETNSLKFSNFSEKEIELWRMGRPNFKMSYELSFWSDLAHWMMRMQEDQTPYNISFEYSTKGLPNKVMIDFPEVNFEFHLFETSLKAIIPSLATVKSPLAIYGNSLKNVSKIKYNKHKKQFEFETTGVTKDPSIDSGGIPVDDWMLVPDVGFYAKESHLQATGTVTEKTLLKFLESHKKEIKERLEGLELSLEPRQLKHKLSFDPHWNLHIESYVFKHGDLKTAYAGFWKNWVYVEDRGFYSVKDQPFDMADQIIDARQVDDFISQERAWLNDQAGFTSHLSSVEAQLSYTLDGNNRLRFTKITEVQPDLKTKDFGSWIYVKGIGFYSKINTATNLPIQPDISISQEHIPLFIHVNRAELQLVPHFFSEQCPVASSWLKAVVEDEGIKITPVYDLLADYKNKKLKFLEDFVYVTGEGFSEIPSHARLPEGYSHDVTIEPENVSAFLEQEWPRLKKFIKDVDPQLQKPKSVSLLAERIVKSQTEATYQLKLLYKIDDVTIPLASVWKAIQQQKKILFTEAGYIDLTDPKFDWVKKIEKQQLDQRSNTLKLTTLELIKLYALVSFSIQPQSVFKDSSVEAIRELVEFHLPEAPDLTGLKSSLRPYQELGVHWLWFLYRHQLSGLLCDDMGLGKTHQGMALMCAIKNFKPQSAPFLIICPTSAIYHWAEKLSEYLPNLRIKIFHGSDRTLGSPNDFDILLTSYGIWRLENTLLKSISYEAVILDEIQIAKNHASRVHISLRNIKAAMHLGMTGTPVENHLRELKALFDLVLPNYMPSDSEYREIFIKPIEKEGDQTRLNLLHRLTKPFVLRRKKAEVLKDLPEKIEEVTHCDLSGEQALLYNGVLLQSRQKIMEQLQDKNNPVPYMHIFALLNSLKQICNHPAAFLKEPENYKQHHSGKWDLFVELLNEARDSGQKVVIFSQYLTMLDLFEEYLNDKKIKFASIRGATVKRGEEIKRFNLDPKCEVFLGSLRASGLGIDLTGGSVVIHYDRWWNAARENQATDRVHRIGQVRGVQVFKLVTKGSFEERIDAIIQRKGRLMEDVISSDDHRFIKTFDREELMALLEEVEETVRIEE